MQKSGNVISPKSYTNSNQTNTVIATSSYFSNLDKREPKGNFVPITSAPLLKRLCSQDATLWINRLLLLFLPYFRTEI